jgi:hypothetical protein
MNRIEVNEELERLTSESVWFAYDKGARQSFNELLSLAKSLSLQRKDIAYFSEYEKCRHTGIYMEREIASTIYDLITTGKWNNVREPYDLWYQAWSTTDSY